MLDLHGDVKQLNALVTGLRRLATAETRHALAERIAHAGLTRVALEFDEGKDPYGRPWPPPKWRNGKPLRDTGRLGNSFAFKAAGDDVRIDTNVVYAPVHQYGAVIKPKNKKSLAFQLPYGARVFNLKTGARLKRHVTLKRWVFAKQVTIPRRQIIPEGDLGPIWSADFVEEANAFLEELFP